MTRMNRLAVLLVALGAGCSPAAPTTSALPPCRAATIISEGERIPQSCTFERLGGGTVRLSDLQGTPTLLNFWASWCVYCIDEMPALERAHRHFAGRVRFIGVDLLGVDHETRSEAQRFVTKTGVTYDTIFDPGGLLAGHFTVRLVPPLTIWVDASGIVRHRHFGPLDRSTIDASIRRYLGVAA